MSELFTLEDFSAGWCPSDDALNGRKNSLRMMENIEIAQNGGIQMSGGTTRQLSVFTGNVLHSLFQKYINGTSFIYSGAASGQVFRDTTQIKTGGSATKACFNAAYNYVFGFSGDKRFRDDGTTTTDLGVIKPSAAPTLATGATGVLTGDYEYCQVNVFVNGTYRAKSARGTLGTLTLAAQIATVTPQNPSVPGSNATEAWIFRRGVNLDTWYRIARVTSYGSFSDNLSDSDALALNITLNDFLLSMNSTDVPDAILACVGPVYGRMIYFTSKEIIFSDIHSPDSTDSRTKLGLGGASGAEVFKWALKLKRNAVLVATDKDIYLLSGTYVQLPDGFLDVSLDPLAVSDPSIGTDVCLYQNSAIYMSKIGWVACQVDGNITSLCFPNTDYLYNGNANYEYGAVTIDLTGATRYACTISKNKLYCIVSSGSNLLGGSTPIRMEVYDFLRKYWRVAYPGLTPAQLITSETNAILGFDTVDKFIKRYDDPTTKLLDDGSSSRQAINFLSSVLTAEKPNQRKELLTLSVRGDTFSATNGFTIGLNVNGHIGSLSSSDYNLSPAFKVNATQYFTEVFWKIFDVNAPTTPIIAKTFQIQLYGTPTGFTAKTINVSYDAKPVQEVLLRLLDLGLDSINKKRVRELNFIIDTLGSNVTFTPTIDGVDGATTTFNTAYKQLVTHHFLTDVFGFNFSGYFSASNISYPFELYKVLQPEVVQALPQAKWFDQLGPIEMFRYGKIKTLELRLLASGGTSIPYTIYLEDTSTVTGTITVISDKEGVYKVDLAKTVAGTILRIELGPTTFNFYRISTRIQCARSGKDTEMEWIEIDGEPHG